MSQYPGPQATPLPILSASPPCEYTPDVIRAAIDVGSNSVLTTVCEQRDGVWAALFESSEVTALGEGTKATGVLSEDAMSRTLQAIKRGSDKAAEFGAIEVLIAATMAARIASNASELQARGVAQGTPIRILSGDEEAQLGLVAVANDPIFANEQRLTIIDPGGHSTELITAERTGTSANWNVLFRRSYPIGTLAMLSSVFAEECPNLMARLKACQEIDDSIGLIYLPGKAGTAVTLGATGTNLITIREQMTEWNPERVHGAKLDYEEVSKAVGWLSEMSVAERSKVVGMEPGREKTLHAGALILERFMHCSRVLDVVVSVRGWRHALIELGGDFKL